MRPKSFLVEDEYALPCRRRRGGVAGALLHEETAGTVAGCIAMQGAESGMGRVPAAGREELQCGGESREQSELGCVDFASAADDFMHGHTLLLARQQITAERPRDDIGERVDHALGGEQLRAELFVERLNAIGGVDDVADCAVLEVVERTDIAHHQFAAVQLFTAGRWDAAHAAFSALHRDAPGDGPSRIFMEQCARYAAAAPAAWEGVLVLDEK